MSNWIDAHLHLTDARIEANAPALIAEAVAQGISGFILGGVDPDEWDRQKRLHAAFPDRVVPVFGLHPWWIASRAHDDRITPALARLSSELEASPRVCRAIGETGLDFHPRFQESSHALQETVFREHLRLARFHRVPIVLHVVRAHDRALAILREERRDASSVDGPEPYGGIVHSFSEGPDVARAYLDLGLIPSISASVITRDKGSAFEKLRQTVVTLPATSFVLETDSPDQPPAGVSGLNEPSNLVTVAEAVARHRAVKHPGTTAAELLDGSAATLRRVFDIEE
ncbi:MAG: TatD family hydrolase [Bdellovibrionales bacterium]|nr:TatD family hydrolase [Bdellovibrionales bacterium]